MLSRKYRFHGLGSVRPAMRHGVSARDQFFTIKVLPRHCKKPGPTGLFALRESEGSSEPRTAKKQAAAPCESRAAVIVSRKVAPGAVARNRIRRRLFEVLRHNWQILTRPIDVVIIVHDVKLKELSSIELENKLLNTLKAALKRAGANSPADA